MKRACRQADGRTEEEEEEVLFWLLFICSQAESVPSLLDSAPGQDFLYLPDAGADSDLPGFHSAWRRRRRELH